MIVERVGDVRVEGSGAVCCGREQDGIAPERALHTYITHVFVCRVHVDWSEGAERVRVWVRLRDESNWWDVAYPLAAACSSLS
jgi:hypothetical protein